MNILTTILIVIAVSIITPIQLYLLHTYLVYSHYLDNNSIVLAGVYISLQVLALIFIPYITYKVCWKLTNRSELMKSLGK